MGCNLIKINCLGVMDGGEEEEKPKKTGRHGALSVFYEEACGLMPQLRSLCSPRELKKSITNNGQLLLLAKEYMEILIAAMKLLAAMKLSLSEAHDKQSIVLEAIECFEKSKRSLALSKLKEFMDAGSPVTAPFAAQCVHSSPSRERLETIAKRLALEKDEIRGRLGSMKVWKKARRAMCNVAFVSVLVLSVVLAAVSAPPFAPVAAAAGGTVINSVEQWLDSVCDERLDSAKGGADAVSTMVKGVSVIHESDGIRAMVKWLERMTSSIWGYAAFAVKHGDQEIAVVMAMEEIKAKVGVMQEWVGALETKMGDWDEEVRKAVTEFLNVVSADA